MLVLPFPVVERPSLNRSRHRTNVNLLKVYLHLLELLAVVPDWEHLLFGVDVLEKGRKAAELSVFFVAVELFDAIEVVWVQ